MMIKVEIDNLAHHLVRHMISETTMCFCLCLLIFAMIKLLEFKMLVSEL